MTLKAVFLDIGNTLVREDPSRFEIYAQAARRHGVPVTENQMNRLMRKAHEELPREVGGAFRYSDAWFKAYIERVYHDYLKIDRGVLPALSGDLFARFSDPTTFRLFDGALELLDELRERGLRLGIVSNWSARLPKLLEALGIAKRVDFVVCSAIERVEKPDTAIFERALALSGVSPGRTLHAGDHLEKDVYGARRAGIRGVLVDHARVATHSGTPRVSSLADLRHLVVSLST
jgi:putative hydrolase of the HAD superfamily